MRIKMKKKICSKCKIKKSILRFSKDKRKKSGLCCQCKDCRKIYNDQNKNKRIKYYEDHKETILFNNQIYRELKKHELKKYREKNKTRRKEQNKKWKNKNKELLKEYNKKWKINNKNKYHSNFVKWKNNNLEHLRRYRQNRRKQINIKLIDNIRRRINMAIKSKKNHSIEYLGIDIESYKKYLQQLFDSRMNWNNYGIKGWHIDHIIPISSAKNEEELIKLFHYTNTQPLWAEDNLKKSNKILRP